MRNTIFTYWPRLFGFLLLLHVAAINLASCSGSSGQADFPYSSSGITQSSPLCADLFAVSKANEDKEPKIMTSLLSDVVKHYIPDGTTFSQAETLLISAGFSISPHPTKFPVTDWPYSGDIIAMLDKPLSVGIISAAKLTLRLKPKSPGDYSIVDSIQVIYSISTP